MWDICLFCSWHVALSVFLCVIFYGYFVCRFNKLSEGSISSMIILGSGGHTAEMIAYVSVLSEIFRPRIYVIARTDTMSTSKIVAVQKQIGSSNFTIEYIPRAREVKQSYFSSIITTCFSTFISFLLIIRHRPRLILCNGPGTCIPLCFLAAVLRVLFFYRILIVFVESVCRTRSMSLSGKLLYYSHCADIIVQWPELKFKYPRSVYLGLLF